MYREQRRLKVADRPGQSSGGAVDDFLAVDWINAGAEWTSPPETHEVGCAVVVSGANDGVAELQFASQLASDLNDIIVKEADGIERDQSEAALTVVDDHRYGPKIIMDGGGIDCLTGSSCPTCMSTFKTLLGKMATAGVQEVIYTRYPEPGAPPGSNASLKACLDSVMPMMQPVCEASTSPKCHWVDLRPVWVAGDTTDGLHATQSGSNHVGDLLWSEMMKRCLAQ